MSVGQQLVDVLAEMRDQRDRLDEAIGHLEAAVAVTALPEIVGGGEPSEDPSPPALPPATATPSGNLSCPDCGETGFRNPQHVGSHRRHQHPGAAKARKPDARSVRHLGAKPPGATGGTPVDQTCPECGKAQPTPGSLRVHLRKEHGIEETADA